MRLTEKNEFGYILHVKAVDNSLGNEIAMVGKTADKLGQLEDIEEELGIDLMAFLKGIDPDTCFMEITKDKRFYLCGDVYYGYYSKEGLLKLIQELLFMYWALTKEELL